MRARLIVLMAAALIAAPVAVVLLDPGGPEPAVAQGSSGDFDLGLAALAFLTAEDLDDVMDDNPLVEFVVMEAMADLYNPFKGDVTYSQDESATVAITHIFGLAVNLTEEQIDLAYTPSSVLGYADGHTGDISNGATLDPFYPPGTPPQTIYDDLFVALALKSVDPLDLGDGQSLSLVLPENWEPMPGPDQPLFIVGARTAAPRTIECPGSLRDYGVLFDTPLVDWVDDTGANSSLFNDFFYAGDTVSVTNCQPRFEIQAPSLRVFQGPGSSPPFSSEEGNSPIIIGPYGWIQLIPGDQAPDATGVRWFEFITDIMAPYNADYTAASAYPNDLTTLMPLADLPHAAYSTEVLPTTTSSTTTTTSTTLASSAPETTAAPTTTVAALAPPATTGGGFPFGLFVLAGLLLIATGGYFWWANGSPWTTALAGGGTAISTGGDEPGTVDDGSSIGVVVPPRPGKGVGAADDSPPLIGLRGWKP